MTELQNKLYKEALKVMPELNAKITTIKPAGKYISFPLFCDGVTNKIIYDVELKQFTKIEYAIGKGEATIFKPSINKISAYFDEVEFCSFDIPETK